jgi:hypothetical protein
MKIAIDKTFLLYVKMKNPNTRQNNGTMQFAVLKKSKIEYP